MEEFERLVAELSDYSLEVNSIHCVDVIHIVDPFTFFIRPNNYKSLIRVLESIEPKTKPTRLSIQDLVIFNMGYSCGAHKYIRGRLSKIEKVDNTTIECEIFAIDYGFTEKMIPVEYLWECPQDLANSPPLAYDCQLANCYPVYPDEYFPSHTVRAFKYYARLDPIQMKILDKKPHKLLVELVNAIPESIATLLVIGSHSTLGSYFDTIDWNPVLGHKKTFFNFKPLTVGEKLRVRVQSGSSLNEFYVADVNDFDNHLKEVDPITFYARREFSLSPLHLIEGTLVCVKNDITDTYERAFIKKVTKFKESAIVQLVDCGKDEEFPVSKIKYMSSQCLRTPVLSIYCKAEESQACDNEFKKFLSPGYELNITIKKLGHEFECPHTVDISSIPYEQVERSVENSSVLKEEKNN